MKFRRQQAGLRSSFISASCGQPMHRDPNPPVPNTKSTLLWNLSNRLRWPFLWTRGSHWSCRPLKSALMVDSSRRYSQVGATRSRDHCQTVLQLPESTTYLSNLVNAHPPGRQVVVYFLHVLDFCVMVARTQRAHLRQATLLSLVAHFPSVSPRHAAVLLAVLLVFGPSVPLPRRAADAV